MSTQSKDADAATPAEDGAIRPFKVEVSEEELAELRERIAATRWPSKELVEDRSQGVQLATIQELARYWTSDYDWRACEAKLNALPQFTTEIDGLDIHFIHVRSEHENALPLIITHGWPGSVIELLEVGRPADRPDRARRPRGGRVRLVVPSLPGYGFSAQPTEVGWDPGRVGRAWAELMAASATPATSPRAATSAPPSPTRWAARHRRGCSAFTEPARGRRSA